MFVSNGRSRAARAEVSQLKFRWRYVVILATLSVAIVLLIVGAIQNADQRALMERSFVGLGRFPGAVAVYKLHEERHVVESYVTPHSAEEIRAYYDQRLHEMGWGGPGPELTSGNIASRCYFDPTGQLTAKVSIRTVPSPGSYDYGIELSRNGCVGLEQ
jgi:hypothetical protein